jgi:sterol 14-demethylase
MDAMFHLQSHFIFIMLASIVAVALVLSILLFKLLYVPLQSLSKGSHSPPQLQLPVSEITRSFFGKRFELIRDGFKATSSSIYQLPLFGRQAIVLSGEESRQLFFKEKGLSIYDSFALLLGSVSSFMG